MYRFDDLQGFAHALRAGDQELTVPKTEHVADNEWVLAIFVVTAPTVPRDGTDVVAMLFSCVVPASDVHKPMDAVAPERTSVPTPTDDPWALPP